MRRVLGVALALVVSAGAMSVGSSAGAVQPAVGTVRTVLAFDAHEKPEGVAVDKRGAIYYTMTFLGELRRLGPDGTEVVVAELPAENGFGPVGIAVDANGDVYVAVIGAEATQGVYKVAPGGAISRVPGTEAIGFANGVAFGDAGTLYVTDSVAGEVWRVPRGGTAELWIADDLLAGVGGGPLGFPIGANGIAYRHGVVYVANTERGSIVAVPVQPDGSAGTPSVLAQHGALAGADGLALDVHGNLFVAVIVQNTIVRVTRDGSSIDVVADGEDGLDYPSSVAFGTGRGERTTLYAVNFAIGELFGDEMTTGPRLLAVEAGVPGLPQP